MAKSNNNRKKKSQQSLDQITNLSKARLQFAADAAKDLDESVRAYQALGYERFLDFITGEIETEKGKITFSAKNLAKVQKLVLIFNDWGNKFKRYILKPILKGAERLLGLNRKYFEESQNVTDTIADRARKQTLLKWGYDVDSDTTIAGSYLESVFGSSNLTQQVARMMNQAIAGKMSLKDFRDRFKAVFVGAGGGGMLEKKFKESTYNLFQILDRAANKMYADQLGMKWAIYSGTVMDTTRPFCEARVNKVFSNEQIEEMRNLIFQGKPKIGYDPFLDCGGINCRHHWSYISDELAEILLKRQ